MRQLYIPPGFAHGFLVTSDSADFRMRIFNADGSEAETCGNGIRCVAKYAYEHDLARVNPLRVETRRGILPIDSIAILSDARGGATFDTSMRFLQEDQIGRAHV